MTKTYKGSCHCGAIRYEAELDLSKVSGCNCTICAKLGVVSTMCKPEELRVLAGQDHAAMYEWGAKTSKRYFCPTCGIYVFGRGFLEQVGGAYASVNVNTLDDVDVGTLKPGYWDGRHNNWQAGIASKPWPIDA
jgi:hypothetical protein